NNEDLQGGLYCAEDGYLDSYSVMQGYARKAKEMGANYVYKAVDVVTTAIGKVTGVQCENGEKYEAPTVINCAGAWAPELSEKTGLPIPVVPLKRQVIQFDFAEPLENKLPLTIDPTGVYFRHEGASVIS